MTEQVKIEGQGFADLATELQPVKAAFGYLEKAAEEIKKLPTESDSSTWFTDRATRYAQQCITDCRIYLALIEDRIVARYIGK